jgi:hypothetical protein
VRGERDALTRLRRALRGFTVLLSLSLLTSHLLPLASQTPPSHRQKLVHTYSIVAFDSATGDLGVAVQSKFPSVGGIVPWAKAGVGAVATQSLANTDYGERGLELLAQGATAAEALRTIMRSDTLLRDPQVGMVDARGNSASLTGATAFDWAGGRVGAPGRCAGRTGNHRGWQERRDRRPGVRRSNPEDLVELTPETVRLLEPILLREPANQPATWLAGPQGRPTRAFLEALRDFMYWENYDVRVRMDGKIDRVVLDDILKKHRT